MNKKTWLLIAIVSAIWICLFPLVVFGEGGTYVQITSEPYYWTSVNPTWSVSYTGENDVRMVAFPLSNGKSYLYVITDGDGISGIVTTGYGFGGISNVTVDGHKYYYRKGLVQTDSTLGIYSPPLVSGYSGTGTPEDAVYYTFGDGAVEPGPDPTNWGLLRDPSYTTRIAGSGQAARRNVDYLTWENSVDANGNDISECEVEIQAVYGKFTGNTLNDLWETDVQDLAVSGSVSLATIPASSGVYSISWQKVIDDLNSFEFDSLFAHEVNEQIEKNGWYYQIRLLGSDGYIGSWQTLYTPLSMGGKPSETIITNNSFDMSVYQVYQDLSTINNNTSITITYIDTDYTINNPNDGKEPEGGTNLWDVLKELISGIFQILAKLGDLVENVIDGLMGIFQNLFTPSEVDQEVNNNINVEVNTYLEESQPGLNQIHNNIDTWKLQLENISSDYANGGDCIIAWEDVSIDLSAFDAGTVTFIPGGTYDLKTAFISLLNAFGVSYSTYEMIVSAIIYISLIVLISHKVKGFLKT